MNDFESAHLILADANAKIMELDLEIQALITPGYYNNSVEILESTKRERHSIKLSEPFPPSFSVSVFHIVSGLRASLDHLIYAASSILGLPSNLRDIQFPITDTAGKARRKLKESFTRPNQEIIDAFMEIKPYKDGNPLLWALDKARQIRIHRMLIHAPVDGQTLFYINDEVRICTVSGAVTFPGIEYEGLGGMKVFRDLKDLILIHPELNESRDEIVFAECDPEVRDTLRLDVEWHLAFDVTDDLRKRPLVEGLLEISKEVNLAIDHIETETAKIVASRKS